MKHNKGNDFMKNIDLWKFLVCSARLLFKIQMDNRLQLYTRKYGCLFLFSILMNGNEWLAAFVFLQQLFKAKFIIEKNFFIIIFIIYLHF